MSAKIILKELHYNKVDYKGLKNICKVTKYYMASDFNYNKWYDYLIELLRCEERHNNYNSFNISECENYLEIEGELLLKFKCILPSNFLKVIDINCSYELEYIY